MLLFVLVAAGQIRSLIIGRNAVLAWVALGSLLAVLVSLHGVVLYVMPVVFFLVFAVIFVLRAHPRFLACMLVFFGVIVAISCLTPYWQGEIDHNWKNSQAMLLDAHKNISGDPSLPSCKKTPLEKIENMLRAYAWLDGMSYFISDNVLVRLGGLIFLFMVIPIALIRFRGDGVLLGMLACVWGVFFCAAAVHPPDAVHYRLLIVMAPLFLAIGSLAFLDYSLLWARNFGSLLLVGIFVSMTTNITMQVRHAAYLFGSERLVAVSDLVDAFEHIPYGASVCDGDINDNIYNKYYDRYIDEYMLHRSLRYSDICQFGYYEIIPKFVSYADIGNGPDAVNDNGESPLGYLRFTAPSPGPPVSANARLIEQKDALALVVLQ